MDLDLKGKAVAITGGSRGIGQATAYAFARQGADVAIAARNQEELEQACAAIARETGQRVVGIAGDLTDAEFVQRFVDEAAEQLGRLDILVCCAGSATRGDFLEIPDEAWFMAFNLKFLSAVRAARAAIPHFRKAGGGVIVNCAGTAGVEPSGTEMNTGFANAAMINFTKALSLGYAKENIRALAVAPGMTNTSRYRDLRRMLAEQEGISEDEMDRRLRAAVPLGRVGEPEDVANLIVFLASKAGRHLTGVDIMIHGGSNWL